MIKPSCTSQGRRTRVCRTYRSILFEFEPIWGLPGFRIQADLKGGDDLRIDISLQKFSIKIMSLKLPSGSLNCSYSCKTEARLHPSLLRKHPIRQPVFFCPVIQNTNVGWLDSSEIKSTASCIVSSSIDTKGSWLNPILYSASVIECNKAKSLKSLFNSLGHKQTNDFKERLSIYSRDFLVGYAERNIPVCTRENESGGATRPIIAIGNKYSLGIASLQGLAVVSDEYTSPCISRYIATF